MPSGSYLAREFGNAHGVGGQLLLHADVARRGCLTRSALRANSPLVLRLPLSPPPLARRLLAGTVECAVEPLLQEHDVGAGRGLGSGEDLDAPVAKGAVVGILGG